MKSSFIEIKNYRCFQETRIDDLGLVNVFGGLNNVGKTTLLEAIYLLKNPYPKALFEIIETREGRNNLEALSADFFRSFYYEQREMNFIVELQDDLNQVTIEDLSSDLSNHEQTYNEEVLQVNLTKISNNSEINDTEEADEAYVEWTVFYEKDKLISGQISQSNTSDVLFSCGFVRVQANRSNLSKLYDKSIIHGLSDLLIVAFKQFLPNIEDIRTLNLAEPILHIKENGKGYRPLALYGDAMNRIAEFVLRIVDCAGGTLLIDEIENGIHYTNHKKVWSLLFQLAEKFEVQIFATSHSAEMINAFNEVALAHKTDQMRYFEMYRHKTSGQIKAKWQKSNVLQNKIESEVDFRGVVS